MAPCDWISIRFITRDDLWPFITRVIPVMIKSNWWTPMDTWRHVECWMNRTIIVTQSVLFTRDVEKSERFILDQTNET